ncbi:MAG: aconitase X catalytic domain-containing protein [Candidatus Heimdallarchaeum aukensis]|uniref:Phosphomevalonate dehydratase large subunit n=1 Tax=Candidatus Heimdallarchaeum aukensis TaxID=2876573 RepID=A0A9Y1BJ49_9ARCH|nr:MAG: aconitase X catalytic domain-containing protein [Candidatus Heimdallarchaeum aukensis]
MYLTKEQERILEGEKGEALSKMLQLIVKIGEVNGAEKLISVNSAQIAGVSYLTVGDAIFSFFDMINKDNLKVKIPSWLNPAGMDMGRYKEMGIDSLFSKKQIQIIEEYRKLGIKDTLTCTPYLVGHEPKFGEHVAWSESSAVSMANSYFGARTNREGGPSSLASALTGLTAEYGLHLPENRKPEVLIEVDAALESFADFSVLGFWFGENQGGKIPFFRGIKQLSIEKAKSLSAAMAASGSVAMYHVEHFTPEYKKIKKEDLTETIHFTEEEKKAIYERFKEQDNIDLIAIGCPHASKKEIKMIYNVVKSKQKKSDVDIMIFTSRKVLTDIETVSIVKELTKKGIKVYADTCMVVSPVTRQNYRNIITNSSKAVFYLSKNKETNVFLDTLENILRRTLR